MHATNAVKDPRCPVCGNAVLGAFISGNEGRYHPACAEPPARIAAPLPPAPVFVPFFVREPLPWWWNPPQWTCETTNCIHYDGIACGGPLHLVN